MFSSIKPRVDWEETIIKSPSNDQNNESLQMNSSNVPSIEHISANESTIITQKREEFLIIYACFMILGIFCYLSRSFSFYHMCYRISIILHDMIFRGVTRARMLFFNANQSGRILNRFARDINSIDSLLPNMMVDVFDVSSNWV